MSSKIITPWSSISDMALGLMMVFLFISVSYAYQISKQVGVVENQNEKISQIVGEYHDYHRLIYEDLVDTFGHKLEGWDAEINENDLSFRFNNPAVLFEVGSSEITPEFELILQEFWSEYVIIMKKYDSIIREVRIEGHTSSDWGGFDIHTAYFKNMELSQSRTRSALERCYLYTLEPDLEWVRSKVTANGMSSSRLVTDARGFENAAQSRRVEFTVVVDSDKRLEEISREL